MKKLLLILLLLLFTGCNEVQTVPDGIRPLKDLLLQPQQNWVDAYGDDLETRLVYNIVVLRNNQLEIAKMISRMHPPIDPNVPTDPNE